MSRSRAWWKSVLDGQMDRQKRQRHRPFEASCFDRDVHPMEQSINDYSEVA